MKTAHPTNMPFHTRLTWLIVGALALLAITSAAVSTSLIAHRAKLWIQDYLHTSVAQVASTSTFVFLTEDEDTAQSTLAQLSTTPGIRSAALITDDARVLAHIGTFDSQRFAIPPAAASQRVSIAFIADPEGVWHVWSQVIPTSDDQTPYQADQVPVDQLGWIYVAWDSAVLDKATWLIFAVTLGAAAFIAAIVAWLVRLLTARITRPLSSLSGLMRAADTTAQLDHAPIEGSVEFRDIAHSYNALVDTVRAQVQTISTHAQDLEHQVAARTGELEAALSRNEALMRTLSHDMRTPVHSVMGYLRLAREELQFVQIGDDLPDYLERATLSSEVLLARLEELLDFARLQAGATTLTLTAVDLHDLVDRVESAVGGIAKERNNQLTTEVIIPRDASCHLDEQKLEHILGNLVSNACHYTDNGAVHVFIELTDDALQMTVSDSGSGIAPDRLTAIFEPFQQETQAGVTPGDGIGLGLHIAHGYCELMAGTLTVESAPGQGSTFKVLIPVTNSPAL